MRITASGLVVVSAFAAAVGCGDKKRDGLPPSSEWQAPAGSGDAAPVHEETPEEQLARCAAAAYVADAARDGNMPNNVLDDLSEVPDAAATVLLRALVQAAARLPEADQHAMLLADATFRLVERGDTASARRSLERVESLLRRPADPDDMKSSLASDYMARAWGRLGDVDAIARLGAKPATGPHLARGLAEGGHDQLADDALARLAQLERVDPLASAALPITELVRGRLDRARARVAAAPGDWRAVHALLLATAAVEREHPEAATLVADAVRVVDAEARRQPIGYSVDIELARLELTVGQAEASAKRRARLRAALAAERDGHRARVALNTLVEVTDRAGAADEAEALVGDLESRHAPPWMFTLTRAQRHVRAGALKEAIEEVERLSADANPPRGVVFVETLVRYLAGPRDPEFERWLGEHICR